MKPTKTHKHKVSTKILKDYRKARRGGRVRSVSVRGCK